MKSIHTITALKFVAFFFILIGLFISSAMATEEPDFSLILKEENIEIREYAQKIIAQVEVSGDFDEASSRGFKLLADFIFGNNITDEGSEKISMTSPVEMYSLENNIQITSPVMSEEGSGVWSVNFTMPKKFTLESLPKPANTAVEIIQVPKEKYVVIVFSGLVTESSYNEKAELLDNYLKAHNLETIGPVKVARYNPPWTLPFFRRNELMVKIN
jgi:effector-binding domain-containing protein